MKTSGICPKCGGTELVGPNPGVRIALQRLHTATLNAITCSKCGYVEFYSDKWGLDNIRRFGKAYKHPKSVRSLELEQHVCLFCNTPIQPDTVICPECGKNI